jgi:hypothetical protein
MAIIGFLACLVISASITFSGAVMSLWGSAVRNGNDFAAGMMFLAVGLFGLYQTFHHAPFTISFIN